MESITEILNCETLTSNIKKCRICGQEYKSRLVSSESGRFKITVYEPVCNCEKRQAEIEEKNIIERKRKEKEAALLTQRFNNSMLTKRLRGMTFDSLSSSENQNEIIFCKKYIKDFNIETSKGIQMLGNTGVGKSSLLACVCNSLIKKGYNCLFTTLSNLLGEFIQYSSENYGSINFKLNWLLKFDFIVLDDIGRENLTEKRKEILFQIVDALYNEEKIIAFTANPEMIRKLKKDEELDAILNRIKSLCPNRLEFHGSSLR